MSDDRTKQTTETAETAASDDMPYECGYWAAHDGQPRAAPPAFSPAATSDFLAGYDRRLAEAKRGSA